MEKKSQRSGRGKIIACVLLFLAVVILIVLFLNRDNIKALYRGLTTDVGNIGEMMEQNNNETKDALAQVGIDVSDEEFSKINSGELSAEEIAELLYNRLSAGEDLTDAEEKEASDASSESGTSDSENRSDTVGSDEQASGEATSDTSDSHEESSKTKDAQNGDMPDNSNKGEKSDKADKSGKTDKADQPNPNEKNSGTDGSESKTASDKVSGVTNGKNDTADKKGTSKTDAKPMSTSSSPSVGNASSGNANAKPNESSDSSQKPSGTNASSGKTSSNGVTDEEYNRKVAELVAQIYVIKSDFMSQLSSFESNIINAYKALPEEQRTTATKARIVSENMGYVAGLEAQCDAQVSAVTSELSAFLISCGKDTSLVNSIQAAYANEKELKKAYYISLYK